MRSAGRRVTCLVGDGEGLFKAGLTTLRGLTATLQ